MLISSIAAGIIILAGFEFIARLFLPFPVGVKQTYQNYPDVLFFHKPESRGFEISPYREFSPNFVRYNEFGFRGASPKDNKLPAIIIMGDSFVEARQVSEEDSFPGRLAKTFKNYYFVNAGCSAYTTTTEFLLLKNRILSLKPKKVILMFSFNDYADNFIYQGGYFRHPELFSSAEPPSVLQPNLESDNSLTKFSSVAEFLRERSAIAANTPRLINIFLRKRSLNTAQKNLFQSSFLEVNTPTSELDIEGREVLEFTHKGLSEMAKIAKRNKIEFEVYIIPLPSQVDSQEWQKGETFFYGNSAEKMKKSIVYQTRLLSYCTLAGIKCVDLLPYFRKAKISGKESLLYFPFDGHWTKDGHEVVTGVLASNIEK
jgi:hypothetical protein